MTGSVAESASAAIVSESESTGEYLEVGLGQVIVFMVDRQRYALPIEAVQEIQQIVEYTSVSGTAAALVGMIDLRGTVVPLIDLRLLLAMPAAPYRLDTPLVFAHVGGRLVAYLVDEVDDVVDLTGIPLQAPSRLYTISERLIGVARLNNGLLFVLDSQRLVPEDALASVDDLVQGWER